jgi:hypothetical protein
VRAAAVAALAALQLLAFPALAAPQSGGAEPLRLLAQIGVVDGPAEYTFGLVNSVALLPNGSIAVTDLHARQVRLFDATGRFLRSVGRPGSGPGEFQSLSRITVRERDFTVWDGALRRYTRISFDGREVEVLDGSEAFLRHGFMVQVTGARFSSEMVPVVSRNPAALPPAMHNHLLVGRPGVMRWDTLLVSRGGMVYYYTGNVPGGLTRGFGGSGIGWAIAGDSLLAAVDAMRGIVRVYRADPNGLTLRRTVPLGLPQQPVTAAAIRELVQRVRREHPRPPSQDAVLLPPPYSALVGPPHFDDAGRIWLARWDYTAERELTGEYLIVEPSGRILRQRLPPGFILHSIRGDRIAGVVTDDLDVQYVRVYQIPQTR